MIYFLQNPENGLIKIGFTSNFESRYTQLCLEYGFLDLLGVMNGDRKLEYQLHQTFKPYLAKDAPGREWFQPDDEIINMVKKLTHKVPVPSVTHIKSSSVSSNFLKLLLKKQARESVRYSKSEIAEQSGVEIRTVNRWINDTNVGRSSLKDFMKLVDWLGCEPDDLINLN